jgi:hypothetical protein
MTTQEWLNNAILKGFQGLLMLRLQGAPAQDTVQHTLNAWLAVLVSLPHTWDQERDQPRIRKAFVTLGANCDRWPAPKNFLDAMPAPPEQKKLPEPQSRYTPESRRMVAGLLSKMKGNIEKDAA